MHRTFFKREPEVGVIDVLQDICMPDLDAFRPARCAAGVDERQDGVRMVNWVRNGVALNIQRVLIKHQLPRSLRSRDRQRRMANQSARLSIVEDAVDFFNRKPCVQWNYDYSAPGAGINELDVIRLVRKKNGQPVSGFETMFRQCRSNASDAIV